MYSTNESKRGNGVERITHKKFARDAFDAMAKSPVFSFDHSAQFPLPERETSGL
jgi:hypothetical protein